jgi:hypothetical protein
MRKRFLTLAALLAMGWSLTGRADSIIGTSGSLSATADFTVNGSGELILTLTNSASTATVSPGTTLTGIFFNYSGSLSLSKVSASLTAGSTVKVVDDSGNWQPFTQAMVIQDHGNSYTAGNIGGEWGLSSSILGGYQFGIGSAGYNIFSPNDRFDTNQNLAGPDSLDGNQFGLASASTFSNPAPSALQGENNTPVDATSATFDLGNIPNFDFSKITAVRFQYGTDTSETSITVVPGPGNPPPPPEPAPLPATATTGIALLLAAAGWRVVRRRAALA